MVENITRKRESANIMIIMEPRWIEERVRILWRVELRVGHISLRALVGNVAMNLDL